MGPRAKLSLSFEYGLLKLLLSLFENLEANSGNRPVILMILIEFCLLEGRQNSLP